MNETPHGPRFFQTGFNFSFKATHVRGEDPFGQIIRACKLFLQESRPFSYSSSGIKIETLSPLSVGFGSWLEGVSQIKACAKDKWGLGRDLVWFKGAISGDSSSIRHFQGIMVGLEVLIGSWDMAGMIWVSSMKTVVNSTNNRQSKDHRSKIIACWIHFVIYNLRYLSNNWIHFLLCFEFRGRNSLKGGRVVTPVLNYFIYLIIWLSLESF